MHGSIKHLHYIDHQVSLVPVILMRKKLGKVIQSRVEKKIVMKLPSESF